MSCVGIEERVSGYKKGSQTIGMPAQGEEGGEAKPNLIDEVWKTLALLGISPAAGDDDKSSDDEPEKPPEKNRSRNESSSSKEADREDSASSSSSSAEDLTRSFSMLRVIQTKRTPAAASIEGSDSEAEEAPRFVPRGKERKPKGIESKPYDRVGHFTDYLNGAALSGCTVTFRPVALNKGCPLSSVVHVKPAPPVAPPPRPPVDVQFYPLSPSSSAYSPLGDLVSPIGDQGALLCPAQEEFAQTSFLDSPRSMMTLAEEGDEPSVDGLCDVAAFDSLGDVGSSSPDDHDPLDDIVVKKNDRGQPVLEVIADRESEQSSSRGNDLSRFKEFIGRAVAQKEHDDIRAHRLLAQKTDAELMILDEANGNSVIHEIVWKCGSPLNLKALLDRLSRSKILDKFINMTNKQNETPLEMATRRGDTEKVRLLVKMGCDVNVLVAVGASSPPPNLHPRQNSTRVGGRVPLICFVASQGDRQLPLLDELLLSDGAKLDFPDSNGYAPLHLAVLAHRPECNVDSRQTVRHLVMRGADANLMNAKNGKTPIQCAVERGDGYLVQMLLDSVKEVFPGDHEMLSRHACRFGLTFGGGGLGYQDEEESVESIGHLQESRAVSTWSHFTPGKVHM